VLGWPGGAVTVTLGDDFSCGLTDAGLVMCWGANGTGQLGDGTTLPHTTAQRVALEGAVSLSAGSHHACAVRDGGVVCWGQNAAGQLGDDTTDERDSPVWVLGLDAGIVAVTCGISHSCALTAEGALKCWGRTQMVVSATVRWRSDTLQST